MPSPFLRKLISIIKANTDPDQRPVNFIMDTLSMGKESAYRRLRGETSFTFEEVSKISKKLLISLDDIGDIDNRISKTKWALVNTETLIFTSSNYLESYLENMKRFMDIFSEMTKSTDSILRSAVGNIPDSLILPYKKLSLFKHYKWIYLTQEVDRNFSFDKMIIPSAIQDLESQFIIAFRKIPRILCILNRTMFINMANDINYFFREKLISKEEFLELITELLDLLSFVESLAQKGIYEKGAEINLYLSDVNLDSTYVHIKNGENEYAMNWAYYVDILTYQNEKMCQKQKMWIELLKRFSTYITQTGEQQRSDFFQKQRILIERFLQ